MKDKTKQLMNLLFELRSWAQDNPYSDKTVEDLFCDRILSLLVPELEKARKWEKAVSILFSDNSMAVNEKISMISDFAFPNTQKYEGKEECSTLKCESCNLERRMCEELAGREEGYEND